MRSKSSGRSCGRIWVRLFGCCLIRGSKYPPLNLSCKWCTRFRNLVPLEGLFRIENLCLCPHCSPPQKPRAAPSNRWQRRQYFDFWQKSIYFCRFAWREGSWGSQLGVWGGGFGFAAPKSPSPSPQAPSTPPSTSSQPASASQSPRLSSSPFMKSAHRWLSGAS